MRNLYSLVSYGLVPLFLLYLLYRGRRAPAYRLRWRERFACYRTPPEAVDIWLHAVSVGEVEAAVPLIQALLQRNSNQKLLITTTTPTGSARVVALFGDRVQHCYLPYDLPDAVGRFMRLFQPKKAIVMETEIWPNLYRACWQRSIPLTIVNARLSERSARRYHKLASLVAETLNFVSAIAAQSQQDAKRFIALGAADERVVVSGNIKFDQPPDELSESEAVTLRQALFGDRPCWIAASTHEGEEAKVLTAFRAIKAQLPAALLILVPRHPERFEPVASLCRGAGFTLVKRSDQRSCNASDDVFLLDTMGELKRFYRLSDIAFIGGSLVPTGGHNLLEAAAVGIPVLFGPSMDNFAAIADSVLGQDAAIQVADEQQLAVEVERLLTDAAERSEVGERGRQFVERNRGALDRVMALIDPQ